MNETAERLRKAIDLLAWIHTLDTLQVGTQPMEADRVKARKVAEEIIEDTRPSNKVYLRSVKATVDFLVLAAARPMGAHEGFFIEGGDHGSA